MADDTSIYDVWLSVNDAQKAQNSTAVSWEEWRKRALWTRSEHNTHQDSTPREVYLASTTLDGFELRAPLDFDEVEKWCDYPYRIVWVSTTERVILTYCEGDLSYEVCATDDAFQRSWMTANTFYQNH